MDFDVDVDVSKQFPRTYFETIIPRVTTTTLQYSKRTKSSLSALPRQSFHSSHCGWRTNIKKSASQRYEILAKIKASKKKAGPITRVPAKIPSYLRNLATLNVNLFVFSHKNDNSGNMNKVSQCNELQCQNNKDYFYKTRKSKELQIVPFSELLPEEAFDER